MSYDMYLLRGAAAIVILLSSVTTGFGQLPATVAEPSRSVPPETAPEVTRKTLFSIPFYLNPAARQPNEVLLYVSGNRGKSWSLYQRRSPQLNKFDFQAGEDGEYWFVVRTSDNPTAPQPPAGPEKVVIVDRSEPDLDLVVRVGPAGELVATYRADDANLDAISLQLKYRVAEQEPWQPIALDRDPNTGVVNQSAIQGQTTWAVSDSLETLQVMAEVADRAGNRRQVQQGLAGDTYGNQSPQSAASALAKPAVGATVRSSSENSPPLPWLADAPSASVADNPSGWRSMEDGGWPAGEMPASDSPRIDGNEVPHQPQAASSSRFEPDAGVGAQLSDRWSSVAPQTSTEPQLPPTDAYAPPVANRVSVPEPPTRRQVKMTNQRRFNLDYDVEGAGGVSRVELWATDDNGSHWQPYGLDRDLQSPFVVQLEREGVFGFRMLIHDEQGKSARPPQAGDDADLWVGLDWTPPKAQLLNVVPISDSGADRVRIEWRADDDFLGENPIRLSYAHDPASDWTLIADLPNSGSYVWVLERPLPQPIFLRLEVRDRAENVTTVQPPHPIGGAAGPTGVIRGIRPFAME